MTRLFGALLLAAITACCATVPPPNPKQHAMRLEFQDGVCSGTVTGPNRVTTATHCLTGDLVALDGKPVEVIHVDDIAPDISALYVDRQFDTWAEWSDRKPEQGDRIYYWGNPSAIPDIYRVGYVAGYNNGTLLADVEVGQGDSGAAVFDDSGRIVGVVSGYGVTGVFRMALIVVRKE